MKKIMFVMWTMAGLAGTAWAEENKAPEPVAKDPVKQEVISEPVPKVTEPVAETPVAAPAETPKAEEVPVPAEQKPLGCVIHLSDLVSFHEKEVESMKGMIKRWNDKVGYTLKKQQDYEKQILEIGKEIDVLSQGDEKKSKKEIVRLQKQSARISKDLKAFGKELKAHCKELAAELKAVSKESQAAMKEKFQGVISDVQQTLN